MFLIRMFMFTLICTPRMKCRILMCVVSLKVIQLLKAGKAKEVSYNALASHIISEDGDNPEVGEAREVFDLPVVKVSSTYFVIPSGMKFVCR